MSAKRTLRTVSPAPVVASEPAPAVEVTATVSSNAVPDHVPAIDGPLDGAPIPAGVVGVVPTMAAVAVADSTAVARPGSLSLDPRSGLVGEWDASDIKFPAVRIVQGSGELSKRWNVGTLLLGDDELLPQPDMKAPKPEHFFRFVPITIEKQFREKLTDAEVKSGLMPRIVNTVQEVEQLGGTTEWMGDVRPSWEKTARILMLVERPVNLPSGSGSDHPGFVMEMDGKLYAAAVYYAGGSAFNVTARLLFNAALTTLTVPETDETGAVLKNPNGTIRRLPYLPKSFWTWRTIKREAGDYTVFNPEFRLTKDETSAEVRAYIDTLRG